MLPKLADLPKVAEEKAKTEAELRSEVRSLKAQLRTQPAVSKEVKVADPKAIQRAVSPWKLMLEELVKVTVKVNAVGFESTALKPEDVSKALEGAAKEISRVAKLAVEKRSNEFESLKRETARVLAKVNKLLAEENITVAVDVRHNEPFTVQQSTKPATRPRVVFESNGDLSRSQMAIVKSIAEFEAIGRNQISKSWIAARAGASFTSSSFTNNLGFLRVNGYIAYPGPDLAALTDKGRDAAGEINIPSTSDEMLASCLSLLSNSQAAILRVLYESPP